MSAWTQHDYEFMQAALKHAQRAYQQDEVPVGCVIVRDHQVISYGYNLVETNKSALCHAEMIAIEKAAKKIGDWRLEGCTLYTTLEPCSMCAGAILLSRIPEVVWSAPDLRHGANGSFVDLFLDSHPTHRPSVRHGLLEEESCALLKSFFAEKRKVKQCFESIKKP